MHGHTADREQATKKKDGACVRVRREKEESERESGREGEEKESPIKTMAEETGRETTARLGAQQMQWLPGGKYALLEL